MLPFPAKDFTLPSSNFSYVFQAVDGSAPLVIGAPSRDYSSNLPEICSVMAIPFDAGRSSSTSMFKDRKRSKSFESFETIAKRNGIKVSYSGKADEVLDTIEPVDESVGKMSGADYFEIVARRNGIKVSSPVLKNENDVPGDGHSFLTRGRLSPRTEIFVPRNNPCDTDDGVCEYLRTAGTARGLSSDKDGTDEIGACNSVDEDDVQKLFEMLLEEKKEFERKQFQILQDYISEQKNSKHEIESLATDKAELQEKINTLTRKLEALENEQDSAQELHDETLRQHENISKQLAENVLALRERNTLLSNEVEVMTDKIMELTERDVRLKTEITTLSSRLEETKKKNDRLDIEVEKMTLMLKEQEGRNERLSREAEILVGQIRECEKTKNTRRNLVDICVQTELLDCNSSVPASQPLCPIKKRPTGSIDSLDKITVTDNDYDWTVVMHTRKTKGKKESCQSNSPPGTSQKVANKPGSLSRSGSLREIILGESPPLDAGDEREVVEELLQKAPKMFDSNFKRHLAQPTLSKTENANVDKTISSLVVQEVSTSSEHCACVGVSQEIKTATKPPDVDVGTLSSVDRTPGNVGRKSSSDGLVSPIDNATAPCVGELSPEAKGDDVIETNTPLPSFGTAGVTTRDACPSVVNASDDISQSPIGSNLPEELQLANLDLLAKQLGFGENWHQTILNSCSGMPTVSNVPIPPPSIDLAQVLCGQGANDVSFCTSTVSGSLGTESEEPTLTSYLPYGQPDRGQCSYTGIIRNGRRFTKQASDFNTSSYQRLMVKLSEKFPSKTRANIIIYLKKAKSSFGEQGFRKRKLEEIVQRVGDLIHQDEISSKMCCICRDVLEDDEKTLECGHKFHGECVAEWISNERTCPLCRTHALTQDEFPTLI